jgi:hypothetical protein
MADGQPPTGTYFGVVSVLSLVASFSNPFTKIDPVYYHLYSYCPLSRLLSGTYKPGFHNAIMSWIPQER